MDERNAQIEAGDLMPRGGTAGTDGTEVGSVRRQGIVMRRVTGRSLRGDAERALVFSSSGIGLMAYVAQGFTQRLRGLIGTRRGELRGASLLFFRCASIHTFGMSYPLDVLLAGCDGQVLVASRSVQPCRLVSARDAVCALEREASDDPWPEAGDEIRIVRLRVVGVKAPTGEAGRGTYGKLMAQRGISSHDEHAR
jgi:hypothetical protein